MFAIIETGGKQYRVQENDFVFVEKLEANEGDSVVFDKVLMVNDKIGAPYVEGAVVKATVLKDDVKGNKVIVFKKIRRKGFQKLNGHRQKLSLIKVDAIA